MTDTQQQKETTKSAERSQALASADAEVHAETPEEQTENLTAEPK